MPPTMLATTSVCRDLSMLAICSIDDRHACSSVFLFRLESTFARTTRRLWNMAISSPGSGSSAPGASQSASCGQASCLTSTSRRDDRNCRFEGGNGMGLEGGGMAPLLAFELLEVVGQWYFLYWLSAPTRRTVFESSQCGEGLIPYRRLRGVLHGSYH